MLKALNYSLSLSLAIIQVIFAVTGLIELRALLVTHTLIILSVILLEQVPTKRKYLKAALLLSIVVTLAILGWYLLNLEYILTRPPFVNPISSYEVFLGLIIIGLILFGTLVSVGWPLVVLTIFFLLYAGFLGPYMPGLLTSRRIPLPELVEYLFFSDGGVFGTPIYVSATYVFLFILFGSFLQASGIGRIFTDLALVLTGRTTGGPAKASVISSALFGTVSGSAVANVVMSGTFTIPLMKSVGYRPSMAGAVETVASTGGQLMPPVMGAAAFLMAYLLGISYWAVALAAVLPALLYYSMLFVSVDLEARKHKIGKALEIPNLREVIAGIHFLLPLVILAESIALWYDVPSAAYIAFLMVLGIWSSHSWRKMSIVLSAIVFIYLSICIYIRIDLLVATIPIIAMLVVNFVATNSIRPRDLLEGFLDVAKSMGSVAMASASAGMIVGVLTITGLGLRFTSILTNLAGGNLLFLLILTAIAAYILGMGMPTTAVYITTAILLTPALIMLGVSPLSAHMFTFYTAMLSMITPPVALAAYAAAGIAKESPFKVGFDAMKLGFLLFVLPFLFVYKPALLLNGTSLEIVSSFLTLFIAIFPLSMAFIGYSVRKLQKWERAVYFVSAALLLSAEVYFSIIGVAIFFSLLLLDLSRKRVD
jgi:TRAP transporter 4TM/12TM fusion protein